MGWAQIAGPVLNGPNEFVGLRHGLDGLDGPLFCCNLMQTLGKGLDSNCRTTEINISETHEDEPQRENKSTKKILSKLQSVFHLL